MEKKKKVVPTKPVASKPKAGDRKGVKKTTAPTIQHMPCHKVKYDKLQHKRKLQKQALSVHKNLIVNILLYACADLKTVLRFGATCKRFRECSQLPIIWFYLYTSHPYPLHTPLGPLPSSVPATCPEDTWAYIRNDEEVKVDWEQWYKEKFANERGRKVKRVEKGLDRFFETDIKKAKKDMRKFIKAYKFNFKITYDKGNGSCIIPASKVNYFEHSLCMTYHPKKLMTISKLKDFEVQAVSKEKDLKRTVTKPF